MAAERQVELVGAGVLAVLVLLSAVSVVYARHDARQLFIELQQLTAEQLWTESHIGQAMESNNFWFEYREEPSNG